MIVRVVLVVPDSPLTAGRLASLASERRLLVLGVAYDLATAHSLVRALRPDVVALSNALPGPPPAAAEDFARQLMVRQPVPIVVFDEGVEGGGEGGSGTLSNEAETRFRTAGVALVLRSSARPGSPAEGRSLAEAIVAMSGIKVVRLRGDAGDTPPDPAVDLGREVAPPARIARVIVRRETGRAGPAARKRILALASSTGGPQAILTLLRGLPEDFPAPILVVQHITEGFLASLVTWLRQSLALRAKIAEDGETLVRGTVYIAPDDLHLGVGEAGEARLSSAPPVKGFRPSGTVLFEEVARVYGPTALGAILTGMGDDGVEGLRALRASGGLVIAQDERSSIVFGMPRVAIEAGVVDRVLPLADMAAAVRSAFGLDA